MPDDVDGIGKHEGRGHAVKGITMGRQMARCVHAEPATAQAAAADPEEPRQRGQRR